MAKPGILDTIQDANNELKHLEGAFSFYYDSEDFIFVGRRGDTEYTGFSRLVVRNKLEAIHLAAALKAIFGLD